MTTEYAARFWRYVNGKGQVSGRVRIMAEDFHGAVTGAQLVLDGMRSVAIPNVFDKKDQPTYQIHSVTMASVTVTPCEGMLNIWAASDLEGTDVLTEEAH